MEKHVMILTSCDFHIVGRNSQQLCLNSVTSLSFTIILTGADNSLSLWNDVLFVIYTYFTSFLASKCLHNFLTGVCYLVCLK